MMKIRIHSVLIHCQGEIGRNAHSNPLGAQRRTESLERIVPTPSRQEHETNGVKFDSANIRKPLITRIALQVVGRNFGFSHTTTYGLNAPQFAQWVQRSAGI